MAPGQPEFEPRPLRAKHNDHKATMFSDAWHNVTEMNEKLSIK